MIFYRGFWIPASLITLFCCLGAWLVAGSQIKDHKEFNGIMMFVGPFFWIKTITNVLMLLYILQFKAHEMYFYANLGIRKRELLGIAFLTDYLIFFIAIYLTGLSLKLPLISF